jgi:soluble lytic murein transglycosylase-like protein
MIGRLLAAVTLLAAVPSQARAEIVIFNTGRTLSVAAHRGEGETLVLTLRSGGEMVLDRSLVREVRPDEVPYPIASSPAPPPESPRAPAVRLRSDSAYDPIIRRLAAAHGVDAALVRAVIQVESAFEPRARSNRGAVGLMQVMPATARQYGIRNPYDPSANIEAGVRHLHTLLARFPLALALAAYNAGEGAVQKFHGIPPYPETRAYVARVLALVGG